MFLFSALNPQNLENHKTTQTSERGNALRCLKIGKCSAKRKSMCEWKKKKKKIVEKPFQSSNKNVAKVFEMSEILKYYKF